MRARADADAALTDSQEAYAEDCRSSVAYRTWLRSPDHYRLTLAEAALRAGKRAGDALSVARAVVAELHPEGDL